MSTRYLDMVKMLIFCHRYTKKEDYLLNSPVDFDVVRDPMYLYSQRSQDRFFEQAEFAFLFAFFAKNEKSREFCIKKFKDEGDEEKTELVMNQI